MNEIIDKYAVVTIKGNRGVLYLSGFSITSLHPEEWKVCFTPVIDDAYKFRRVSFIGKPSREAIRMAKYVNGQAKVHIVKEVNVAEIEPKN